MDAEATPELFVELSHSRHYYRDLALADLVKVRRDRLDAAAAAVHEYESRFGRWDERASVRRKPQRSLQPDDGQFYFPPELMPVLSHPLVSRLGSEAAHRLMIRRLYDYLHFTVELEELAVIPVAMKISRGQAGLFLPPGMRSDAFKIVTDEAWHAQFSYDLIREVEARTGVPYGSPTVPAFIGRLDAIRLRLPADVRGLEALLFAVVSETLISRILADLPQDRRLPHAVREIISDHAEDEGRHHAYFRSFLQYLWPALDSSVKRQVGRWIPEIVFAFLEPDYEATGLSLGREGLSAAEIAEVLTESLPRANVVRDVATAASAAVRYFAEVGALGESSTRDAFVLAGLVPSEVG